MHPHIVSSVGFSPKTTAGSGVSQRGTKSSNHHIVPTVLFLMCLKASMLRSNDVYALLDFC